jgi:hypothetical protein
MAVGSLCHGAPLAAEAREMKKIAAIGMLCLTLTACGGGRDEAVQNVQRLGMSEELSQTDADTISDMMDKVCSDLDGGGSVGDAIVSYDEKYQNGRVAALLVGGAIHSDCNDYADEFDALVGKAYTSVLEGN